MPVGEPVDRVAQRESRRDPVRVHAVQRVHAAVEDVVEDVGERLRRPEQQQRLGGAAHPEDDARPQRGRARPREDPAAGRDGRRDEQPPVQVGDAADGPGEDAVQRSEQPAGIPAGAARGRRELRRPGRGGDREPRARREDRGTPCAPDDRRHGRARKGRAPGAGREGAGAGERSGGHADPPSTQAASGAPTSRWASVGIVLGDRAAHARRDHDRATSPQARAGACAHAPSPPPARPGRPRRRRPRRDRRSGGAAPGRRTARGSTPTSTSPAASTRSRRMGPSRGPPRGGSRRIRASPRPHAPARRGRCGRRRCASCSCPAATSCG